MVKHPLTATSGSSLISLLTAVAITAIIGVIFTQMSSNQFQFLKQTNLKGERQRLAERYDRILQSPESRVQTLRLDRNPLLTNWANGAISSLEPSIAGIEKPAALYNKKGDLVIPVTSLFFDSSGKPVSGIGDADWKVALVWKEGQMKSEYSIYISVEYLGSEYGTSSIKMPGSAKADNQLRCISVVGTEVAGPQVGCCAGGYIQRFGTIGRPTDDKFTVGTVECPVGSVLTGLYLQTGCSGETQHSYPDTNNQRSGICRDFTGKNDECPNAPMEMSCRASCCFFPL